MNDESTDRQTDLEHQAKMLELFHRDPISQPHTDAELTAIVKDLQTRRKSFILSGKSSGPRAPKKSPVQKLDLDIQI